VFRGGYIALNRQYIEDIPLPEVRLDIDRDRTRHDRLVSLVEQMLDMNTRIRTQKTQHQKAAVQRRVDATDAEIDKLVYESTS